MNASTVSPPSDEGRRETGDGNNTSNGNNTSTNTNTNTNTNTSSDFLSARRDPETLRNDLTRLKVELDELISHAASMGEQELFDAHDKIMKKFSSMHQAARSMASEASKQFKTGVDTTSDYVKDKPMQSVVIAAAVGLALGRLMAR